MCSIPRTILDASFFELFANIFLWTVCQYHLRPLGGQLYPPTGRDLTENGPKILDNFPDLHSPTYFLAFSFLCDIFSHFPAKYFLIFSSLKEDVPRSSKNILQHFLSFSHISKFYIPDYIFVAEVTKAWGFLIKVPWSGKYAMEMIA